MSLWIESAVRAAVQGTLLALVVLAVCAVAPRLQPKTRCWLWWLVLAQFALGWAWLRPIRLGAPAPVAGIQAEVQRVVPSLAPPTRPEEREPGPGLDMAQALLWLWPAGTAIVLVAAVAGTVRMSRIRRRAKPAPEALRAEARRLAAQIGLPSSPELLVTSAVGSPAALGIRRPCVLVPESFESLEPGEQEMALVHELEHLARRDPLLAVLPELAVAVFWFFPVVYLVRREWSVQRELACDEAVFERSGEIQPYRRLLLKIVGRDDVRLPRVALGATADFGCLRRRLAFNPTARKRFQISSALSILAVGALSVPFSFGAAPEEAGLLKNASFESGREVPAHWVQGQRLDGVKYIWDDTVAHTGRRSLSISKSVERYFPIAEWDQTVPYDGKSQAIEFSGWLKAKEMYKTVLDVQFLTEQGIATHQWVTFVGAKKLGDPPESFDWKRLGGQARIPAGTKEIIVALQCYGPGQIWLDDVSARFVPGQPYRRNNSEVQALSRRGPGGHHVFRTGPGTAGP